MDILRWPVDVVSAVVATLFGWLLYGATQWWFWFWVTLAAVAAITLWWVNASTRQHDQSRTDNEGDPL